MLSFALSFDTICWEIKPHTTFHQIGSLFGSKTDKGWKQQQYLQKWRKFAFFQFFFSSLFFSKKKKKSQNKCMNICCTECHFSVIHWPLNDFASFKQFCAHWNKHINVYFGLRQLKKRTNTFRIKVNVCIPGIKHGCERLSFVVILYCINFIFDFIQKRKRANPQVHSCDSSSMQ